MITLKQNINDENARVILTTMIIKNYLLIATIIISLIDFSINFAIMFSIVVYQMVMWFLMSNQV